VAQPGEQSARGEQSSLVNIDLDPIWSILADPGPIRVLPAGAAPILNLGARGLPPSLILQAFALPELVRHGIDWIEIGDIELDDPIADISWDGISVLALIERLIARNGGEFRLRLDGSVYKIDILEEIGGDVGERWVQEGIDLYRFQRKREREGFLTGIWPKGDLPAGSQNRAGLGQATFGVTAINSAVLTLTPRPGVGPVILEDGQHVGRFLMRMDGTLEEIVATTAPNLVEVDDPTGFAVHDDVEFRADAEGRRIGYVDSPSGIAFGGLVIGTPDISFRGERNYLRNPRGLSWPTPGPDVLWGRVNGAGGTSPAFDGMSAYNGAVISAGDVIMLPRAASQREITGGGTVTAGTVSLTIGATMGLTDNDQVLIFRQAGRSVDFFSRQPSGLGMLAPLPTSRMGAVSIEAEVNGSHTLGASTAHSLILSIKGLTPGTVLEPGYRVDYGGLHRVWVVQRAVADGSGNATTAVLFHSTSNASVSLSDSDPLVFTAPALGGGSGSGSLLGQWSGAGRLRSDPASTLIAEPITNPDRPPEYNRAWAVADVVAVAGNHDSLSIGWDPDGAPTPPRLSIVDNAGAEIVGVYAEEWVPAAPGEVHRETLRIDHQIDTDLEVHAELRWPVGGGGSSHFNHWMWCEGIQLHRGPDGEVPIYDGAYPTEAYLASQRELSRTRFYPTTYEAEVVEWRELWGMPANAPSLQLGATARFKVDSFALDTPLRVVGVRDVTEAGNTIRRLELHNRPELLSGQVRRRARSQFVDVSVQVDESGFARQTVIVSDDPPTVDGTVRAVVEFDDEGEISFDIGEL
jgi:hypothetical protein